MLDSGARDMEIIELRAQLIVSQMKVANLEKAFLLNLNEMENVRYQLIQTSVELRDSNTHVKNLGHEVRNLCRVRADITSRD